MKTLKFSELTEAEKQSVRKRYAKSKSRWYEIRRWKKFDKKRVEQLTDGVSESDLLAELYMQKVQDKYIVEYNPKMEADE